MKANAMPLTMAVTESGHPPTWATVVVIVDAAHAMRVQRILRRCDGIEEVSAVPLGRHTQVRIEARCGPAEVAHVLAELDACVRKGDVELLGRFVGNDGRTRN